MKDKKVKAICAWVDSFSEVAINCTTHVIPKGSARHLPPEAPTQDEADAFRDGLVVGMQIVANALEGRLDGEQPPDMNPVEAYAKAFAMWIVIRREDAGCGD